MLSKLRDKWNALEEYVHRYQKCYRQAHGICYASYFTTVWLHGPYNVFAAVMLALIIISWLFHLED